MKSGLVMSMRLIENIKQRLDLIEIKIDGIPYDMFGDYAIDQKYIGNVVVYDTAPDIWHGKQIERITDIAEQRIITTVKATEVSKLLPSDNDVSPVCNFDLKTLPMGSRQTGIITYLSSYEEKCSDKAKWFDLIVVDMMSRAYSVRLFSSFSVAFEETKAKLDSMIGKYIRTDITHTQYGYQVGVESPIEVLPDDVILKPEIEVAIDIINRMTSNDTELEEYMRQYKYIPTLKTMIDIEPGYFLVNVAAELLMIEAITNISDSFSKQTLIRAAITSRGYLINKMNDLSKPILNINKILRTKLSSDKLLLSVIDVCSDNTSPTKRMYIEIAKFTKYTIDERRGRIDEEKVVSDYNGISSLFGGLL